MYVALLTLNVALFALLTAFYARSQAASLFHPLTTYLAFHGVVFVLRPILSWYYGYRLIYQLYQFSPDAWAKDMALIAANVGLFAFAGASLRWGGAAFRNRSDRFSAIELRTMNTSLWITVAILAPLIAWSLHSYWVLRDSDLDTLAMDSATGTTVNTSANGYLQGAYCMGVALTPILASAGGFRWWAILPALAFALLQAGSGLRGPMISELLCLCALYLYSRNRKWLDWRTLAILVCATFAFKSIGSDRGGAVRGLFGNTPAAITRQDDTGAPLEGMDLGNLEYLEFLVDKVPRATGSYEYFVDNLQLFTEPVPRVLWKDKPIGQPIRFFYLFDYGFPIGMTRSLPGEGWTQLGLFGVAIWCGLWGGVCGWIYNRYARSRQSVLQTGCYMAFLATLLVFFRDGLMITLLRQGVFFLAPFGVWALLARLLGTVRAEDLRRLSAIKFAKRKRMLAAAVETPATPREPISRDLLRALPRSRRHGRVHP